MTIEMIPYQAGDEYDIIKLANSIYSWVNLDERKWRWRFRSGPDGPARITLAWSGDTLAGHYATFPATLLVRGIEWTTQMSLLTMTNQEFRGRGIFKELATYHYRQLKKDNYMAVWGFPNTKSHATFVDALNWADLPEIPVFRMTLQGSPLLTASSPGVTRLTNFDNRFDALWEHARNRYADGVLTVRDSPHLNWRYAQSPMADYVIWAKFDGNGTGPDLTGYCVTKRYGKEVQVMDLLALDDESALALLAGVAQSAGKVGDIATLGMWLNVSDSLHRKLERLGFASGAPLTYAGVNQFYPLVVNGERELVNMRWHLTMGDSDVF